MPTGVAKKTFSIQKDVASQLDVYKNKSKFVNEALVFYIQYLNSVEVHKKNFLDTQISQQLEKDGDNVDMNNIEALVGSEEVIGTKDHDDFISILRGA